MQTPLEKSKVPETTKQPLTSTDFVRELVEDKVASHEERKATMRLTCFSHCNGKGTMGPAQDNDFPKP